MQIVLAKKYTFWFSLRSKKYRQNEWVIFGDEKYATRTSLSVNLTQKECSNGVGHNYHFCSTQNFLSNEGRLDPVDPRER